MSTYDTNPFGDETPFSDPSIQQATAGSSALPQLDDYNPFTNENSTEPASPAAIGVSSAASTAPPAYTGSGAQTLAYTEDLRRQQEELDRKAEELARRDQEIRSIQSNNRQNNWPPLKCVPKCFFQDIDLDIPAEFKRLVRGFYYLWLGYCLLLFLNVIGALAFFIAESGSNDGGVTFGLSILFFLLFVPCSFLCWYRPIYKAFKSDSSFNFFLFFIVFFSQFAANVVMAVGIPKGGFCGWINGLALFKSNKGAAAVVLVIGFIFAALAGVKIVLLIKVHRIYRSSGASFQKAKTEFATNVMRSDATQQAASGAVQSALHTDTHDRY